MKYTVRILALALTLFTVGACTDLEEEIKDGFTEDFDPQNPGVGVTNNVNKAQPNDGIASAFNGLRNGAAWHGSYFSVQEISSDEAVITQKGGDWFDGGIWLDMHRHEWTSVHSALNNIWNDTYGPINEANRLIATGDFAAPQVAMLRTARAFMFWRLMDTFGRIKLNTTPGVDVPQSTRQEAFDFIEAELLAAIPDLPDGRQEYGRVSKPGAYAFLTRLYLNAEVYTGTPRWQDAIDAADEVINSGAYSLTDDFGAVFAPDNVDDPEHIWILPFDESTAGGMNFSQMTLHYPSQLTYRLSEQPWNGYSTLEAFFNAYDATDERRDASFLYGPQYDVNGAPILDLAFDPADPDGAPINYTPFVNELAPNGSRQAGARLAKFSFKIKGRNDMDNDYPLFRLGGVLLDKAEAVARLNGNWSHPTTLMLVNQLRTRAGVPVYTSLDATEFLAERGRELFQESQRRIDLIRFDRWGSAWWEKDAHSDDYKKIFPIPFDQINAANGTLTQNPGY
ncbi:MAG: RagB/SusD family nutrient uptake outer membrane protein [Cytophagia bacterium]|nr:RagB/SusD family nutrient uptake outer membrane protein [Cytophagia bacterium]